MQTSNPKVSTLIDCAFLFAAILISAMPYVGGLGFYADDWDYLGILTHDSGRGFVAQFRGLAHEEPAMIIRPVHPLYFIGCFRAFGLHPLPYHILNAVFISLAVVFLYLVFREFLKERWPAFCIALVFGVVPHYSSDRFWFTGQIVNFSVIFLFLGTWLVFRSFEANHPKRNLVFGIAFLVLSVLSYEITLGWIVVLMGWIAFRAFAKVRRNQSTLKSLGYIATVLLPFAAVGAWKIFRQSRISRHHHFWSNLGLHTTNAIQEAFRFNFWSFGAKMPSLLIALHRGSALTWCGLVVSVLVGVAVPIYLGYSMDPGDLPSRRKCLSLMVLGILIFGLGFVLFFPNARETLEFTTAGLDNRVAMASAPGAACILVAFAGLISSCFKWPSWRLRTFGVLIGFIFTANCLVVDGIAHYWVDAASKQRQILQSLARDVPSLPSGSVLLLDGFCRYSGPGFVFETDGDATGAVQIAFGDPSLRSDVVSPDLHFERSAVTTTYYGAPEERYSYADDLFIYNARSRTLRTLRSFEDARSYLRIENSAADRGCPIARDGNGVTIF